VVNFYTNIDNLDTDLGGFNLSFMMECVGNLNANLGATLWIFIMTDVSNF